MDQVGDKPEEMRKHVEEEQGKQTRGRTESGDEATEPETAPASGEGADASPTDAQDQD
ncbi:hypothetical protein ACFYOV_17095 [Streptomyces sp. NPDC005931]|uniref:hypothetical protein n=1 Tax=Streptomyces sp. NPDC005931 TaxID=3364737 RepID=UPI0036A25ADA